MQFMVWSVFLVVGLPMACARLIDRRLDTGKEEDSPNAEKRAGRVETLRMLGLILVAVAVQGIGRELARLVS